jgi:hypothetical protein
VQVNEGVVTERLSDEKVKVFGWDRWFDRDENMELQPLPGQDAVSEAELPSVESTTAGNDTYRYSIADSVLEGRDDPVDIGDRELWLTNAKKTRTIAQVLSERGQSIINDNAKRDDDDYLKAETDEQFMLRDELQGRRLMLWFEDVTIPAEELDDEQDEAITFTDSVILDAETETGITMDNAAVVEDEADEEQEEEREAVAADGGGSSFPEALDDLISMFARNNQTDRERVETMVQSEAPDGYTVNMDSVMTAIDNRR